MTGQEAVCVAQAFHDRLGVTGLILTKMDGDARGGAALSIRAVTGVPIKFIGTGEKVDALEPFYPGSPCPAHSRHGRHPVADRARSEQTTKKTPCKLQDKMLKGKFDLEDFLDQLQKIKKMGPLNQLLEMIPGIGRQLTRGEGANFRRRLQADRGDHPLDDADTNANIPNGSTSAAASGSPRHRDETRADVGQLAQTVRRNAKDDEAIRQNGQKGQDAQGIRCS